MSQSEAKSYAEENGIIYLETSAKTGENVKELVLALARMIPQDTPHSDDISSANTVQVNDPPLNAGKQDGCCG